MAKRTRKSTTTTSKVNPVSGNVASSGQQPASNNAEEKQRTPALQTTAGKRVNGLHWPPTEADLQSVGCADQGALLALLVDLDGRAQAKLGRGQFAKHYMYLLYMADRYSYMADLYNNRAMEDKADGRWTPERQGSKLKKELATLNKRQEAMSAALLAAGVSAEEIAAIVADAE